jgi:hypothetical protein
MKILTVLGTRPEIIRLSRIIPALDELCDHVLVHTGQNFEPSLSQLFFDQLRLREPDHHLGVRASGFGEQLGQILGGAERVFHDQNRTASSSWATPTAVSPRSWPNGWGSPSSTWRPATDAMTTAFPKR